MKGVLFKVLITKKDVENEKGNLVALSCCYFGGSCVNEDIPPVGYRSCSCIELHGRRRKIGKKRSRSCRRLHEREQFYWITFLEAPADGYHGGEEAALGEDFGGKVRYPAGGIVVVAVGAVVGVGLEGQAHCRIDEEGAGGGVACAEGA